MIQQFQFFVSILNKNNHSKEHAHYKFVIAALSIIAKRQNQPRCPATDEWIIISWNLNTTDQKGRMREKEIMKSAAIWMKQEIIMLNEVSQKKNRKLSQLSVVYRISRQGNERY